MQEGASVVQLTGSVIENPHSHRNTFRSSPNLRLIVLSNVIGRPQTGQMTSMGVLSRICFFGAVDGSSVNAGQRNSADAACTFALIRVKDCSLVVRNNVNSPTELSNHNFSWAVDLDAVNPNIKRTNLPLAVIAGLTGLDLYGPVSQALRTPHPFDVCLPDATLFTDASAALVDAFRTLANLKAAAGAAIARATVRTLISASSTTPLRPRKGEGAVTSLPIACITDIGRYDINRAPAALPLFGLASSVSPLCRHSDSALGGSRPECSRMIEDHVQARLCDP